MRGSRALTCQAAGTRRSAPPRGRAFLVVLRRGLRLGLVREGEPGPDREDDADDERARGPQRVVPGGAGDVPGNEAGQRLGRLGNVDDRDHDEQSGR